MALRNWRLGRVLAAAAFLLPGAVGCGPRLYPVHGMVTFPDGKPLTEGMVVFESTGAAKPITARGEVQADGRYELGTYKPHDGVLAGKYRVLVAPKSDPNAVDKPAKPPPIDPRYTRFDSSGLEFEVTSGPNEFPIKVTRPGAMR
jgi:hypothetical protein